MLRQIEPQPRSQGHRLGRPKKCHTEKRLRPLRLFLNNDEDEKLLRDADTAGMNKHDYVRSLIAGQAPSAVRFDRADPRELLALNSIGNLLNQIARQLNAGNPLRLSVAGVLQMLKDHLTEKALRG